MIDETRDAGGFSNRVSKLLQRVEYRLATSDSELEAIYRLRYEANLREGAILPNTSRKLVDKFDDVSNVLNFGIFIDGMLTAALRLHVLCREQSYSPAYEAFPDLLASEVEAGVRIIDGNRFVADYPRAREFPHLPYVTLRIGILAALHFDCDLITASVRAEHYQFYRREYLATKLCEPRPYPTLVKPLSLISISFKRDANLIIGRHPFYGSDDEERRRLFTSADTLASTG